VGVLRNSRNCQGIHILDASRGHLCGCSAFLLAHRLLHSMIGYWHYHVVRLFVCHGMVLSGEKLYQHVPNRQIPIPSDTFAAGCIV